MPRLHRLETVGSTQDWLHQLAAQGAPAGTAVMAVEQSEGRGRRGRSWASARGGLWLSVLCRPVSEPALEVLSLRVALAAAECLERQAPAVRLQLKWPNDLILDQRKLGGILCEARWQGESAAWVVVGLGINVRNAIPAELGRQAVALSEFAPEVTPETLAPDLVAAVVAASEIDRRLAIAELDAFDRRHWLRGRQLSSPVSGTADGITEDGLLRVRRADGTVTLIRSGTVSLRET
jgi:BirA family biotin operon repressor/biotin-[acetyl-CoA-carboxylase] ligase